MQEDNKHTRAAPTYHTHTHTYTYTYTNTYTYTYTYIHSYFVPDIDDNEHTNIIQKIDNNVAHK